jgi:hydroxymethylglutaryl-CoA lyase
LQNEPGTVATDQKVAFIRALAAAGLPVIECGAFVHPSRVPQMADSDEVCRTAIDERAAWPLQPRLTALVPNVRGLTRAVAAGVRDVAIFAAASDTFSRRNINQSIDESLVTYAAVCAAARRGDVAVRGYLSTAFGCPYEGEVSVDAVRRVSQALLDLGVYQVVLSDTVGVAHPGQVRRVLGDLRPDLPWDRTCTTHAAPRWQTCSSRSRPMSARSTPRPVGSAGARLRRGPPATWPPKN